MAVLDLADPRADLLPAWHLHAPSEPVVVLVSDDASEDARIALLEAGIDDYIPRPMASANSLLGWPTLPAMSGGRNHSVLEMGNGRVVDRRSGSVILHGEVLDLPRKERALLKLLASRPGELFSPRTLCARSGATSTSPTSITCAF